MKYVVDKLKKLQEQICYDMSNTYEWKHKEHLFNEYISIAAVIRILENKGGK